MNRPYRDREKCVLFSGGGGQSLLWSPGSNMKHSIRRFLLGVFGLAGAMLLLFSIQLTIDLFTQGYKLSDLAAYKIDEFRHLNNLYSRSLNQLMAVVFTTVAIAVPLTANLYSLKFLEFFIKDPINSIVLIFVIVTNTANTWLGYIAKAEFIPFAALQITSVMMVLSYAVAFPYLYYIFRFLHPDTLLGRLENEVTTRLALANRQPARAGEYRARVAEAIEHLANIAIKSVDRNDRNTAIESVLTLERLLKAYWEVKPSLPPAWFIADQSFFLGFSSAAVDDLTASRTWVEMKLYGQLNQILSTTVPRIPELTSTVAKTLRKLGAVPVTHNDQASRELAVEYFNTFLRLALNRRDARSVFTVLNEYRLLVEALNGDHPELGQEVAYYFQYYGQIARDMQLNFIVEAVAHDLGQFVPAVWKAGAPNRSRLLDRFLEYDTQAKQPLPGVKKAQAILASFFLLHGHYEPVESIRVNFLLLDSAFIRRMREELLRVQREKYWEVTDQRMNIEYVPDAQREKLREFFDDLLTHTRAS